MIPADWTTVTLGEITQAQTIGTTRRGEDGGTSVPLLKMGNLLWGGLDLREIEKISATAVADEDCHLRRGDVLFNTRNTPELVGKTAFWSAPFEAVIDNNIMRLRIREEFDSEYVAKWMGSDLGRRSIGRLVSASTSVGAVYWRHLKELELSVPPIAEQRRIAEILSTWDRAIETVEALIANAREQESALAQALLTGRSRLPGFRGDWNHAPISAIATRVTSRNQGADLPVLTISSTSGFVRQDEKYSREMAGKSVDDYIVLSRGEFAYNKGNSKTYQFGCLYELTDYEQALVPHVYVCFRLKQGYDRRFYGALFEADYLAPQLGRLVNTGVRNNGLLNITSKEVLGTTVPVPSEEEQGAIADVLVAASSKAKALTVQRKAMREERSALMQQLLTGKRRVDATESEAA